MSSAKTASTVQSSSTTQQHNPARQLNSLQSSLIISLILAILNLPSHFDQIHKSTTMKSFYATSLLALVAATRARLY